MQAVAEEVFLVTNLVGSLVEFFLFIGFFGVSVRFWRLYFPRESREP